MGGETSDYGGMPLYPLPALEPPLISGGVMVGLYGSATLAGLHRQLLVSAKRCRTADICESSA